MPGSVRQQGRSPARKSDAMQLSVVQEQYLLRHGGLGHLPKTVSATTVTSSAAPARSSPRRAMRPPRR
jgi:hypothetical protein